MGKITIDLDDDLHWKLKKRCADKKLKLKELLLDLVKKEVDANEQGKQEQEAIKE